MSKKNKKLRKRSKKRKEKSLIDLDLEGYTDTEQRTRAKEYLEASIKRLKEYSVNIKRDKNDPLWECSNGQKF